MDDIRKGAPSLFVRYFGKLPGQSISQFAAEIKALTDDDVRDLRTGIENGSLSY